MLEVDQFGYEPIANAIGREDTPPSLEYRWPSDWETDLRIQSSMLEAVCFLCRRDAKEPERVVPRATGFFVRVPVGQGAEVGYCVTAQHVIHSDFNGPLYIRVNTRDGKFEDIETFGHEWFLDKDADVAVRLFRYESRYAFRTIGVDRCLTAGVDRKYSARVKLAIGANVIYSNEEFVRTGDEVAILGLFTQEHGQDSNLPIARFGHIARMPSVVSTPFWRGGPQRSEAFLIESLSWGGISGSPVFWFREIRIKHKTNAEGASVDRLEIRTVSMLIGLVNGHKDIFMKADVDDEAALKIVTPLNSGIAVVTLAEHLYKLLLREDVTEERVRFVKCFAADATITTLDSDLPEPLPEESRHVVVEEDQTMNP